MNMNAKKIVAGICLTILTGSALAAIYLCQYKGYACSDTKCVYVFECIEL